MDNEGTTRYGTTPDDIMQDIIGGYKGSKDTVNDAITNISSWSNWFLKLIEIIKNFFAQLKISK